MTLSVTLLTVLTGTGLLPFSEDVMKVKSSGPVSVNAMRREVRITGAAKLAKKWKARGFCPRARAEANDLVLGCNSPKLHAETNGAFVSIHVLRGLPWDADDEPAPQFWFDPSTIGLGGPCPGTTTAGKAECLLREGKIPEAKTQLSAAMETIHRDYAALRMADLALIDDDPIASMEWLEKAGRSGEWGRLASVRQCELSGRCLKGPARDALFDAAGMSAPLRAELKLRELRMLRFESSAAAMTKLFELGGGAWPEVACENQPVCANVLHDALASNDVEARIAALTLYASGPVSQPSAQRPWLADAAADAAVALGAREYAAAALAAATPDVPKAKLASHLKKVISLYEQSGQHARARAVMDYATDAVGLKRPVANRKKPVVLADATPPQFPVRDTELANELAIATLVRSRARAAR